jgi:glutamate N-acetyltransferase / amino-acid N-acetyltransferase
MRVGQKLVRVGGMVKGAGMIAPSLATMLSYVLMDAAVELNCLPLLLRSIADQTFNCVTADGDMSTHDTLLLMANGFGGNPSVRRGTREAWLLGKQFSSHEKN